MEHYLQTLDAHFSRATTEKTPRNPAQNPAQHTTEWSGTEQNATKTTSEKRRKFRAIPNSAAPCKTIQWPLSESNRYSRKGNGF